VTNFSKKAGENFPFLMGFLKSSDRQKPFTALGFSNIVAKSPNEHRGTPGIATKLLPSVFCDSPRRLLEIPISARADK